MSKKKGSGRLFYADRPARPEARAHGAHLGQLLWSTVVAAAVLIAAVFETRKSSEPEIAGMRPEWVASAPGAMSFDPDALPSHWSNSEALAPQQAGKAAPSSRPSRAKRGTASGLGLDRTYTR